MATKSKTPQIRFKGFNEEWKESNLGHKVEFFTGLTYSPIDVIKKRGTLVLRSSNVKNGRIVDADNVYVNSDVVNCDNVQKGDIAVVVRNGSRSLIGKHAQIQVEMNNTVIGAFMTGIRSEQPSYTNALLDTQKFNNEIEKNLGATINQITTGAFKKMIFSFPEFAEQTKIGDYFQHVDKLIEQKEKKYQKLRQFKKAMLDKMFPNNGATIPEIRFKGFSGEWEEKKLGEVLDYIQPTKYLVENTEYDDAYKTPVLTAGKTFILGYTDETTGIFKENLPVIIFDDFTTATKFVSFPFKAKSSAMKILTAKEGSNIKFIFEAMQIMKYEVGGHERHWISKFSNFFISLPSLEEQTKIGNYFHHLDKLINLHRQELEKLRNIKKASLEKMFV